jgi:endonuclease G
MEFSKRKDILLEREAAYREAVYTQLSEKRKVNLRDAFMADQGPRARVRRALMEPDSSDPNGFERLIGQSDFVSVNFLMRGLEAARSVCRIRVPGAGGGWYGTGFLVGPGLLMTNNHVLPRPGDAAQAEAEFGYEHDVEGVLKEPVPFNLDPNSVFFTSADYDVTLVAIAEFSDGGVPLDRFGYLPLLPLSGKGFENEWVTIPQHPGGQPKQMTVRASQIVDLSGVRELDTDRFIHYRSDTEPGSSGAPVLKQQGQVVAIHHKAIPKPGQDVDAMLAQGKEPEWLANEGVRISAISRLLESLRFSDRSAALALDRIERGLGLPSRLSIQTVEPANATLEKDPNPHKADKWTAWSQSSGFGYDADFLPVTLDIRTILGGLAGDAAELKDGDEIILSYLHYSAVIHKARKFPIMTAVNIHGDQLQHPGDRSGRFRRDIRMDDEFQPAANFYERKLGDDPVQFSRGHLVRRLDPCWGTRDEAGIADLHTFHYTNAAPQVQGFNAGDWLSIEDYVLDRAQVKDRKMTVFTGPVFRDQDPVYGESREGGSWRIPVTYWKVAVIEKPDNQIAATAFLQGQTKFIEALLETRVFANLRKNTISDLQSDNLQTTIRTIEQETGLNFEMLREHDVSNALEATRKTRFLRSVEDIIL